MIHYELINKNCDAYLTKDDLKQINKLWVVNNFYNIKTTDGLFVLRCVSNDYIDDVSPDILIKIEYMKW